MEIVSIDTRLFDEMIRRVKSVEEKAVALCRSQEDLGLKKWLDNQEVCEVLGISLRTLQTYREKDYWRIAASNTKSSTSPKMSKPF